MMPAWATSILAPTGRTRLCPVSCVPLASVPVRHEPAESATAALAPSLPTPRGAPVSLHPPVGELDRQDPPDAAGARRRSRN